MLFRTFTAVLSAVVALSPALALAQDAQSRLEAMTAALQQGQTAIVEGVALRAVDFLPAFYSIRDFAPAWDDPDNVEALKDGIEAAVAQGFRSEDFHQSSLEQLRSASKSGDLQARAEFELVASDAAARLVRYLTLGKVDAASLDPNWNFAQPLIDTQPAAEAMSAFLDGDGFEALLNEIAHDNPFYLAMVEALERYRAIAAQGGWPAIEEGEALKPGMVDPRIAILRERLAAEAVLTADLPVDGELYPDVDASHVYSPALATDVKAFQARHGLEADGVIGPRTLLALNRTVQERIDQIRLSLERARWLLLGLEDDFVLVNIAGPKTYLRRDGEIVWRTRSITGRPYRKTPVFRDEIEYMEVNPTWTVPQGIFRNDKLPKIRRDVGYIERGGYSVRRLSDGKTLAPSAVNWGARNPGVTLVQRPGPKNALGLIKFMFPNDYAVYLHDTDDRSLFDRNERNLSSGCIRVENPFELANLLMQDDPDWSTSKLDDILDSGKTTRINLPEPMPVLLTYWTAWVEDGEVHFREDIYERDAAVLKALNANG